MTLISVLSDCTLISRCYCVIQGVIKSVLQTGEFSVAWMGLPKVLGTDVWRRLP